MVCNPRADSAFIVENAKYLSVHKNKTKDLGQAVVSALKSGKLDIRNFSQHEWHPKPSDPNVFDWIFVLDTLNFCFWTAGDATKWRVDGQTGYFALCAAIKRAMREGFQITSPVFYSKITLEELKTILRSDDGVTMAPLLDERVECLHEVGKILINEFNGTFATCVERCENSAAKLLSTIVTKFPCFRDEALFCGRQVGIYKRAQILVGDVWACFRGEGKGFFNDIDCITMFADYRVPQVLVHFGLISYEKALTDRLQSGEIMKNGDPAEVEIRGASIFVVGCLLEEVLTQLKEANLEKYSAHINEIFLDHFLWDYRREHAAALEYIPFHKVMSIYY